MKSLPTLAELNAGQSGLWTSPGPAPVPESPARAPRRRREPRQRWTITLEDHGTPTDPPAVVRLRLALKHLLRVRRFRASVEAVRELDELGSPVTAFVRECCTVASGQRVERDELYRAWVTWCGTQGREHPANAPMFGRDLAAAFPGIVGTRPRIGGVRVWHYEGICIGVQYDGE